MLSEPKRDKWQWRLYLTAREKRIIERADAARETWLKLNRERAGIQNRAIQRAKHAAQRDNAHCRRIFSENVKYGGMP